jgi:hypothetical protein
MAGQEGSVEPFAEGPVTDNLGVQEELAGQARRLGEQSEVLGQIAGECAAKSRLWLDIPQVRCVWERSASPPPAKTPNPEEPSSRRRCGRAIFPPRRAD